MIRLGRHYFSTRSILFVLGEGILIYCAMTLASIFFLHSYGSFSELLELSWSKILLVSMVAQISLYFHDLYEFKAEVSLAEIGTRLVQSLGIMSIVLAVVYFLWPQTMIGEWIFSASVTILVFFLISWRILYAYVIHKKLFAEKAILIGDGELAQDLLQETRYRKDVSYDIKFVVCDKKSASAFRQCDHVPLRFGFDKLCDLAADQKITSIIVALDQKRGIMPYDELLNCKVRGISIIDGQSFYERITGRLLVEKMNPSWLTFSDGFVKSRVSKLTIRLVDFTLSLCMLLLLSPLMLVVAAVIKLDSKGPVLFSQERVGENEKIFTLYKFRSMNADAEKQSGPVWAADNDLRVTRVGSVIRKVRIDELPQLWNILRGDMSFVGPRPERAFFVEKLKKGHPIL